MLSAYREFLPAAPRELNGFFAFNSVPPAPPFPEELHLRKVCGDRLVLRRAARRSRGGDGAAAGRRARAAAARRAADAVPGAAVRLRRPLPAGDQWYWRADFVNEIPDEAVEIHAQYGAEMPTMQSTMHMYPIDGAAHDVGPTDTAWSYRDATLGPVFAGVDPDPANGDAISALERRLLRGAAPVLGRRRLREHDDGRGPGAGAGQLPRQLRPAGADQGASTTPTTSSASTRTSSPPHPAHEGAALIPASAGSPAMPLIASDATKVRAPVRR